MKGRCQMRKAMFILYILLMLFPAYGPAMAETYEDNSQQKDEIRLKEIVVVATREEEDVIRIPGNVSVITMDDIQKSAAKELSDILRNESGIMVTNTSGSTPTGITVEARGFNNGGGNGGRTLVLIDGWKANQADTSTPDWASIPLDNIERVEIIRGPATAIYGDSAMAGVINIITKSGSGAMDLGLGVDGGSWQRFGQKISFQGATEKFEYFLYGNNSNEKGYRENSEFNATNLTTKLSYQLNPTVKLTTRIGYLKNDRQLPGTLTEGDLATVGRKGSVTDDQVDTEQFNFGLGSDIVPNDNHKLSVQFYGNNSKRDALSSIPGAGSTAINDDEKNYSLIVRYTLHHSLLGMENKIITGVDILDEKVDSTSLSNYPDPMWPYIQQQVTDYNRDLIGVYAHDSLSITDRIVFDFGIRFDRGNFDYQNTTRDLVYSTSTKSEGEKSFERYSPKAAFTYLFANDISAYLSYAKTFRFPNRDELTGFWGFTPQLDPEKGDNYEVGFKTRLGPGFHLNLSAYYMIIEDEIFYRPPEIDSYDFGQNENFEEVLHRGMELSFSSTVVPRTVLYGTYTYTNTEIEKGSFEGSEMPITPNHMGSITATTDLGGGFSFWNQLRLVGERYLASDLVNAMDKLPSYQVWDMNLSYEYNWKSGTLSAFFGINNVLDEAYTENGGVGGRPFGSRVGIYPAPERNYAGGVNFKMQF